MTEPDKMDHHKTPEAPERAADTYVHPSLEAIRNLDEDSPEYEEMMRKIIERDFQEDIDELARIGLSDNFSDKAFLEYLIGKKVLAEQLGQWQAGAGEAARITDDNINLKQIYQGNREIARAVGMGGLFDQWAAGSREMKRALRDSAGAAAEALDTGIRGAQGAVIQELFPDEDQ